MAPSRRPGPSRWSISFAVAAAVLGALWLGEAAFVGTGRFGRPMVQGMRGPGEAIRTVREVVNVPGAAVARAVDWVEIHHFSRDMAFPPPPTAGPVLTYLASTFLWGIGVHAARLFLEGRREPPR